ncbi:GL21372 [Drosophila persimilis]|uniref:GL21372 n=1 Tax=Drosophila persimilis TaxID=7234 RepID=B4HAB7_DROPE|nr:GL21372 [Drosophila persimilis]
MRHFPVKPHNPLIQPIPLRAEIKHPFQIDDSDTHHFTSPAIESKRSMGLLRMHCYCDHSLSQHCCGERKKNKNKKKRNQVEAEQEEEQQEKEQEKQQHLESLPFAIAFTWQKHFHHQSRGPPLERDIEYMQRFLHPRSWAIRHRRRTTSSSSIPSPSPLLKVHGHANLSASGIGHQASGSDKAAARISLQGQQAQVELGAKKATKLLFLMCLLFLLFLLFLLLLMLLMLLLLAKLNCQ